MKLVKVRDKDGNRIYINPTRVVSLKEQFYSSDTETNITITLDTGDRIEVVDFINKLAKQIDLCITW